MQRTFRGLVAGLVVLTAACGDDTADPAASPAPPAAPTTAAPPAAGPDPARPQAIVSLSPTHTEMLFALGAGEQVIAVDNYSNFPPEAAELMVGIDAYQPSVEAVAGLEPDLVVLQGGYDDLVQQLDGLGIDTFVGPAPDDMAGLYEQITEFGDRIGRPDEAAALVDDVRRRVDAAIAALPDVDEPLTYYHELDNTFFSVTSDTFIGAVYDELGLVNIADPAGVDNPYPQLSAEFIIDADPDLIFLADAKYSDESAATVAARPGWESISAVVHGGVVELDDDVASRWGPRIADYIEQVGDAVTGIAGRRAAG